MDKREFYLLYIPDSFWLRNSITGILIFLGVINDNIIRILGQRLHPPPYKTATETRIATYISKEELLLLKVKLGDLKYTNVHYIFLERFDRLNIREDRFNELIYGPYNSVFE